MDRLEAHGVSIGVPGGWEAELSIQENPLTGDSDPAGPQVSRVVVHVANYSLRADRGDYGSEAVAGMDRGGIFLALIEFDEASVGSMLFAAEGVPQLRSEDFTGDQLLRPRASQAGVQRFFQVSGRAFCLYAVIGSYSMRRLLAAEANSIVSTLAIE